MINTITNFFISGFVFPGILLSQVLIGIGLGIVFGAIWYASYWTPVLGRLWPWAILASSAIISWAAISFVQIPLQAWSGQALSYFFSQAVLMRFLLLASIPQILLSGLVQEGSKLVPVAIYWWRKGKKMDPKLGLVIGAVAGLGFGVFEAVWVHNSVFIAGWSFDAVKAGGLVIGLVSFWERFFIVAFHTAASAIAGWGLAKGWGWQFYLIASFAHGILNYSAALYSVGILGPMQLSIYASVWSLIVTAAALWLRYRKTARSKTV